MSSQVLAKIGGKQEGSAAVEAAVRLAGGVDLLVFAKSGLVEEAFAAAAADVRPRLGMLLLVLLQVGQLVKLCPAAFTDMRAQGRGAGGRRRTAVHGVKALVGLDLIPASKCCITVSTGELRESCVGRKG